MIQTGCSSTTRGDTTCTINVSAKHSHGPSNNADNPTGIVAGNQHWGHATSPDLYHWTNEPIAISPSSSDEGIFSGSAVVDRENTSGFFPNQNDGVVAVYTVDTPDAETQNIAYSTDGGYTFTKYESNPVIPSNSTNFRDPQVVWHAETRTWVMAVAYAADRVIGFYTSPNLRDWNHASNFSDQEIPGKQFECPNLVKFSVDGSNEEKHVLFISINPGAPLGGSITTYLVGHFDGTHFTAEDSYKLMDFAKDNYASQWYSNIPEGRPPVSIAWGSNWQYTEEVPTGQQEGYRGSNSLPRINTLRRTGESWTVTSSPYSDLSPVRGPLLARQLVDSGGMIVNFSSIPSNAIVFDVRISGTIPTSGELTFNLASSPATNFLDGGVYLQSREFWINRGGTHGFTSANNTDFTPSFNTSVPPGNALTVSGVVDRSLLEVFLNGGEQSATASFYPTSPLEELRISSKGLAEGVSVQVDVWGLESGWRSQ